jgi:hypothetical protein
MVKGIHILASLLALGLLSTAPLAHAEDSPRDVIEREVPVLKDGTRLALADIERAILAACKRNKFRCRVVEPGVISARRSRWSKSLEVMIPYSDAGFSIQYDSQKVDVPDEHVAGLVEVIEADLARELVRVKSLQKPVRRNSKRINPRYAA